MGIWGEKWGFGGKKRGNLGQKMGILEPFGAQKRNLGTLGQKVAILGLSDSKFGLFGSPQPQLITFRAEIRPFWGLREGK